MYAVTGITGQVGGVAGRTLLNAGLSVIPMGYLKPFLPVNSGSSNLPSVLLLPA